MKTIVFWVGTLSAVILGDILIGGHAVAKLQLTSAVTVFAPVFFFLWYSLGLKGLSKFGRRLLRGEPNENDISVMDRASSLGFLLGFVGAMFGIIHVMENLTDSSRLGAGIALAYISLLYGAIPAILLLPLCASKPKKSTAIKAGGYSVVASMILLFSFFAVLYATSPKADAKSAGQSPTSGSSLSGSDTSN